MKKFALCLSTLLLATFANAHTVWVEPIKNSSDYVVKFGHEETESYPEHKLKSVQLLDKSGQLKPAQVHFSSQGEGQFQATDASLVFVEFDNGVWSKLPSGKYVEKTKKEEPTAELSINPVKLGKGILHWSAQAQQTHNMSYELIPQSQPKAGEPLAILVLHKGQPVEGIKVGLGEDKPFQLTNSQGIAMFVPTKGYNKVWAEFEENVKNHPDYDSRSIEYMLTFEAQ